MAAIEPALAQYFEAMKTNIIIKVIVLLGRSIRFRRLMYITSGAFLMSSSIFLAGGIFMNLPTSSSNISMLLKLFLSAEITTISVGLASVYEFFKAYGYNPDLTTQHDKFERFLIDWMNDDSRFGGIQILYPYSVGFFPIMVAVLVSSYLLLSLFF